MKRKIDKEILETMWRNPSNWRGAFYYNKKDPRLVVPKLIRGFGWTFNFGSIYSYLFIFVIILLIAASHILL